MQGTSLTVFAWRNLWRNRRRTLLTLASISFGVFLAVLMTGVTDRHYSDLIDLAAKVGSGHVTIQHPEYLDTPTMSRSVNGMEALAATAAANPQVVTSAPRILGPAMIATANDSFGGMLIAIDPERESADTLSILDAVEGAEMFTSADDKGIILGAKLADNLGAQIGDRVVYTITDRGGEMTSGVARLRARVATGSPSIDGSLSMLAIGALREALGYGPDEATQLAIFIDDQRRSGEVARGLRSQLPEGATALAWHEIQRELSAFIAMDTGGATFMQVVLAILISAGIFNTLFVSVMERLREFGILLAIGFSPSRLFRLVILESFWLGVAGLVMSVAVTAGPYLYLVTNGLDISGVLGREMDIAGVGMPTHVKVGLFPASALLIATAAMAATLLAGLYPAWRAGRVEPVESIRMV